MKKNKSYLRSIAWASIIIAGAFLILPVIFPEDAAQADKKLSAGVSAQEAGAGDAALPVVFSENPLSKFFKKLSKFYGFGKKAPVGAAAGGNVFFSDEREVFPLTASATDSPSVSFGQDNVSPSSAPMVFSAADGTVISADQNGYYYGKDYYKNGDYPSEELKKSIESAIARYHTAAAAAQDKKPVYVQNQDGSLNVRYVSDGDYDRYMAGAKMGEDGTPQNQFFASSKNYSGATIASKDSLGSSASGSSSSQQGTDVLGSKGVDGQFVSLSAKLQQNRSDSAQQKQNEEQKAKEDFEKNKLQLLSSAGQFISYRYVEPSDSKRTVPTYNAGIFANKPLIMDSVLKRTLVEWFNLNDKDFNNTVSDVSLTGRSSKDKDPLKSIEEKRNGAEIFKVLAWQKTEPLTHSIHKLKKEYGEDKFYFDHIGVPVNDPTKKPSERKSFTETFFEDTGLKAVLVAADVNQDKIEAIEAQYKQLDAARAEFAATLKGIIANDPSLKNLKTTTTYFLGKDENDNLVVATPKSFLYSYTTPAPEWISKRAKAEGDRAYISVPVEEFANHLKDNGNITVVTTERAENKIKDLGANSVVNIPSERLSSFAPADMAKTMEEMGGKIMAETNRVALDSQKESLARAQQLLEKTKADVKANAKGVNATGKAPAKKAAPQPKAPLRNEYLGQKPKPSYEKFLIYKPYGQDNTHTRFLTVPASGNVPPKVPMRATTTNKK